MELPSPSRSWLSLSDKDPSSISSSTNSTRSDAWSASISSISDDGSTKYSKCISLLSNLEQDTDNYKKPMRKRKHEVARMDTMAKHDDTMIADEDDKKAAKRAWVLEAAEKIWPKPSYSIPSVVQMYIGNLDESITSTNILPLEPSLSL